ncbi:MAG TPA: alpha/beta fold hydrolase [Acidimicrobiia bacterium]|nr:alpha/beta fold hydrolase [Acidimicrobiia bacterium]
MTRNDLPLEIPIYRPGPYGPVLTVVAPSGRLAAPGLVVVGGAGTGGSTKADGVFVRVARAGTMLGYDSVRFDWHGVGGSLGEVERFSMVAPFVEDVEAAIGALDGDRRPLVMVGFCYGSRAVLEAALSTETVAGVLLVSYPMPKQLSNKQWAARKLPVGKAIRLALRPSAIRGWFDGRSRRLYLKWVRLRATRGRPADSSKPHRQSENLVALAGKIRQLISRGVRIRFVYGVGDKQQELFRAAVAGPLSDIFSDPAGLVDMVETPGDLYGWTTVESQERAVEAVVDFARQFAPTLPLEEAI